MATIKKLTQNGEDIIPITHEQAVLDSDGVTLESKLNEIQTTLEELFQNVSNGKTLIATAITDKGIPTSSDETFQQMADKIRQIISSETPTTYTVANYLTNCTTNNNSGTIVEGSGYSATITVNDGYELSSITVTMGGVDITSSSVSSNIISISNVTGNIIITANATRELYTYAITNNLTNCTTSNSNGTILEGNSYSATITANEGYELGAITVTMGGTNVTSSVVSSNVITIPSVTGNIVISCTATVSVPVVDEDLLLQLLPQNANFNTNVWTDSSGNGRNATLYNFTNDGSTNGLVNGKMVFTTANNYAMIPTFFEGLTPINQITITIKGYRTTASGDWGEILSMSDNINDSLHAFMLADRDGGLRTFTTHDNWGYQILAHTTLYDQEYELTAIYDMNANPTTMEVYVNGELASNSIVEGWNDTTSFETFNDTYNLYIGTRGGTTGFLNFECSSIEIRRGVHRP